MINAADARAALNRSGNVFFRWWLGTLAGCVPAVLRSRFERARQTVYLSIGGDRVRLDLRRGKAMRPLEEIAFDPADPTGAAPAIRRHLRWTGRGAVDLCVLIPRSLSLRRGIGLPAAAAENLRDVLGFEMDGHTPYRAEDVHYDFQVTGNNPKAKRIDVEMIVVPRSIVDGTLSRVRDWGLRPDRVTVGDTALDDDGWCNLMARTAERKTGLTWLTPVLMAVLAMLSVAAVLLPLYRQQRQLALTEAAMEAAHAQAVMADTLKQKLATGSERGRFLLERKNSSPGVTALMDELSRRIPDNTWINQLTVREDRLTLTGFSAAPFDLIGILERSNLLAEVQFNAPVLPDAQTGLDRVNLIARVSRDAKEGSR
jgi:general secretion pathway protein L